MTDALLLLSRYAYALASMVELSATNLFCASDTLSLSLQLSGLTVSNLINDYLHKFRFVVTYFPNKSLCVPVRASVSTRTSSSGAVHQKPVRQNMAFSVPGPIPCQCMIPILLWQRFSTGQASDNVIQQFNIQMTLQCQLIIFFELRCQTISRFIV